MPGDSSSKDLLFYDIWLFITRKPSPAVLFFWSSRVITQRWPSADRFWVMVEKIPFAIAQNCHYGLIWWRSWFSAALVTFCATNYYSFPQYWLIKLWIDTAAGQRKGCRGGGCGKWDWKRPHLAVAHEEDTTPGYSDSSSSTSHPKSLDWGWPRRVFGAKSGVRCLVRGHPLMTSLPVIFL